MPCKKIKWEGFLPRIPNQKAMYNCLDTHNLRPGLWQAHGSSLHMNRYAPDRSYFTWWLTSTDEGFLHTHLPMFWGQSSVEHHCCQWLLLHAHNNRIAAHVPNHRRCNSCLFWTRQQKRYHLIVHITAAPHVSTITYEPGRCPSSQYGVNTSINAILSTPRLWAAPITSSKLYISRCHVISVS